MSNTICYLLTIGTGLEDHYLKVALKVNRNKITNDMMDNPESYAATFIEWLPLHARGPIMHIEEIFEIEDRT